MSTKAGQAQASAAFAGSHQLPRLDAKQALSPSWSSSDDRAKPIKGERPFEEAAAFVSWGGPSGRSIEANAEIGVSAQRPFERRRLDPGRPASRPASERTCAFG